MYGSPISRHVLFNKITTYASADCSGAASSTFAGVYNECNLCAAQSNGGCGIGNSWKSVAGTISGTAASMKHIFIGNVQCAGSATSVAPFVLGACTFNQTDSQGGFTSSIKVEKLVPTVNTTILHKYTTANCDNTMASRYAGSGKYTLIPSVVELLSCVSRSNN
jgi:hypothetical protein